MRTDPGGHTKTEDDVAVVHSMWLAQREGDIDKMLTFVHERVLWQPISRPARSVYEGHEGVRELVVDAEKANGTHWFELDEIESLAPGYVQTVGRLIKLNDGELIVTKLRIEIALRDGLIHDVEAFLAD